MWLCWIVLYDGIPKFMFPLNKTPRNTYEESSVASCSHVFLLSAVFHSDITVFRNLRLRAVPDLFRFGRQTVAEVERWPRINVFPRSRRRRGWPQRCVYACVALCLDAATDFSRITLLIYKNYVFGFELAVAVGSRIFVMVFFVNSGNILLVVVTDIIFGEEKLLYRGQILGINYLIIRG